MEGDREKASKKRKARGPRWALWETLLACHVVIVIRNKFAQGISGPEQMRECNRLYAELTDEWGKNNLLLDHNGLPDTRVSVEVFKQHRISSVDSSTRKTPILRRFEDMVCKVRNELLPILDKDGYKPASGDEDVEGDGGIKTSNLEDFHPPEFYVACKYGPTVLGGSGEVYFLKDALDMQEALANGAGSRNTFRSKKRTEEGNAAGAAKKKTLTLDGLERVKLCIHWFERMQLKLTTASCPAVYVVKTVPSDAKVLAEALGGSRQTVWYPILPSCRLVPRVSAAALDESAVLCALIHAPPALPVSGYAFARPTLHTSGIHAVRRLKVV